MSRRVIISGLGPVTGLGLGIEANWQALSQGHSAIAPITAFDPSGFDCRLAAEVKDFKIGNFVPKTYRKATKVMARDIELAVAAADLAARDAKLVTKGTAPPPPESGDGVPLSYPSGRVGANIGASLIACELDELTSALAEARKEDGSFDIHKWGEHGMQQLTPLWLLKYLPNMLACHVTIIHDAQGPSNTITCAEASSGLSLGEAMRVIQRGAADVSFCGGAESKINPMAFLRQQMLGRLSTASNDLPAAAVRPFDQEAAGMVLGEAGGIVILEALDTFTARAAASGARAYAEVVGFGASQTCHPATRNLTPDPQGRAIRLAIQAALREAGVGPEAIDLILPFGSGQPAYDQAEAQALKTIFGGRLAQVPVVSTKPMWGNCGAASGALDVCAGAQALVTQTVPPCLNRSRPLEGLGAGGPARPARLAHVLTYATSLGGQNAAVVLKKV